MQRSIGTKAVKMTWRRTWIKHTPPTLTPEQPLADTKITQNKKKKASPLSQKYSVCWRRAAPIVAQKGLRPLFNKKLGTWGAETQGLNTLWEEGGQRGTGGSNQGGKQTHRWATYINQGCGFAEKTQSSRSCLSRFMTNRPSGRGNDS